jgi:hypothetical protein
MRPGLLSGVALVIALPIHTIYYFLAQEIGILKLQSTFSSFSFNGVI